MALLSLQFDSTLAAQMNEVWAWMRSGGSSIWASE